MADIGNLSISVDNL
jgi:hypothetical protein